MVFKPSPDDGNEDSSSRGSTVLVPQANRPWSTGGYSGIPASSGLKNQEMGIAQAQAFYLRLTNQERSKLQDYYNVVGKAFGYRKPKSLWNDVVEASADSGMTPWQIMEQMASDVNAGAVVPESTGTGAGGPRAFYNETVNLTNPEDAQILVQNALSQYLGRNATEQELAAFTKALRKEEQASPAIDQGVSGRGGTTRTTSGGVSAAQAQEMAKDFAQSRPDYAEFQASTNLLDAFIGVLENKGRIV